MNWPDLAWTLSVLFALGLDWRFGEPLRWHPLVGFGRVVASLENKYYANSRLRGLIVTLGVLIVALLVLMGLLYLIRWGLLFFVSSIVGDATVVFAQSIVDIVMSALVLYVAIGWQSLNQHARDVSECLQAGDIKQARVNVAKIVSRDTRSANERAVASATIESVLENGNDAIFGAIFWLCVAGIPGVLLYRMINTLDAMWGYKNSRYLQFGWTAARLDDVVNFIPARLTAISYALVGNVSRGLRCWYRQAARWKSPNAGPVMAAGAGSLTLSLGYHGERQWRPRLGLGRHAQANDIERALQLIRRAIVFWWLVILTSELIGYYA